MTAVTEDIRVTSVYEYDEKTRAVFGGVPLANNTSRTRSARHIVRVKTASGELRNADTKAAKPAIGQHWRITGEVEKQEVIHGDYKIMEWHFVHPDSCLLILPHTGEDFIRFIAKEVDFRGIGEVKARELWAQFGKDILRFWKPKIKNHYC